MEMSNSNAKLSTNTLSSEEEDSTYKDVALTSSITLCNFSKSTCDKRSRCKHSRLQVS